MNVMPGVSGASSDRHPTKANAARKTIALNIAMVGLVAQTRSTRLIDAIP
jgi:hypothetical protein